MSTDLQKMGAEELVNEALVGYGGDYYRMRAELQRRLSPPAAGVAKELRTIADAVWALELVEGTAHVLSSRIHEAARQIETMAPPAAVEDVRDEDFKGIGEFYTAHDSAGKAVPL